MERIGLVGAMPLGLRWRSQGYIDGTTKYLGTFDTEDEAHEVFMREKSRVLAQQEAEAASEVERILAGPTYRYEGGKGRGASFNGTLFKVVEAYGPHQAVVVPLDPSGTPDFASQTKVSLAYLTQVPDASPEKKVVVESTPVQVVVASSNLEEDVLRFATRDRRRDVSWALDFVEKHARGEAVQMMEVLLGNAGVERQLEWLRVNTNVSSDTIRVIERQVTSGLFMDGEARSAARVLHKGFPDSFEEPDSDLQDFFDGEVS